MKELVFVHGRAQQGKDSVGLKSEWIEALRIGLGKSNLQLPIDEARIRFPYYGDTLIDLVDGRSDGDAADVVVRGDGNDADKRQFMLAILQDLQEQTGITDEQVAELAGDEVAERGVANWGWVQSILKAVDRYVPGGSGASIALVTNDAFHYLKNSTIRERIEIGVAKAISPGVETVVVSHSLGTVVTYNLLRREGHLRGWKVPFLVTLGSPLGVTAIRKTIRGFAPTRCPECVSSWFNVRDERDVVALYPLDVKNFPLVPELPLVENTAHVQNHTENRHGIEGYLDDREVALRIYGALIST